MATKRLMTILHVLSLFEVYMNGGKEYTDNKIFN